MRIIENIKEGNSTQKDFFFKKLQEKFKDCESELVTINRFGVKQTTINL